MVDVDSTTHCIYPRGEIHMVSPGVDEHKCDMDGDDHGMRLISDRECARGSVAISRLHFAGPRTWSEKQEKQEKTKQSQTKTIKILILHQIKHEKTGKHIDDLLADLHP